MNTSKTLLALSLSTLLAACGGGSSSSDGGNSDEKGTFTLAVNDAPVDSANAVVLAFNEVVLVPVDGGDSIILNLSTEDANGNQTPEQVDLLQYQGSDTAVLVNGTELPVGDYRMCLYALDGDGTQDLSYVDSDEQGIVPLKVNSKGSCHGTKPDVSAAGRLSFDQGDQLVSINAGFNQYVAHFDLRKGLVDPVGKPEMFIKPNAVVLQNIKDAGAIAGVMSEALYEQCVADMSSLHQDIELNGGDMITSEYLPAAYLYAQDLSPTEGTEELVTDRMGDAADAYPADSMLVSPLAISTIENTAEDGQEPSFEYYFGFLGETDENNQYSVGFSCVADLDLAESHETGQDPISLVGNGFVVYRGQAPVDVVADEVTTVDFDLETDQ